MYKEEMSMIFCNGCKISAKVYVIFDKLSLKMKTFYNFGSKMILYSVIRKKYFTTKMLLEIKLCYILHVNIIFMAFEICCHNSSAYTITHPL